MLVGLLINTCALDMFVQTQHKPTEDSSNRLESMVQKHSFLQVSIARHSQSTLMLTSSLGICQLLNNSTVHCFAHLHICMHTSPR